MRAASDTLQARTLLLDRLRQLCVDRRVEAAPADARLPSGFDALDAVLNGGWPVGTITELMPDVDGIGELSLLLPALARLTHDARPVAMIAPPHLPYAPALRQRGIALGQFWLLQTADNASTLWAAEQLLRCQGIGAVLAWPAHLDDRQVRRLQLAAEAGRTRGFLYRPAAAARAHSPAALRLRLASAREGMRIEILKMRGGHAHAVVVHPAAAAAA